MSEPLSSSEIEDVLSSIRRLVSEDMRPQHSGGAKVQPEPVAKPKAENKLILTPALRVVQTAEDRRRAEPLMFVATPRVDHGVDPDHSAIETLLASVGAGVNGQDDDWEAEIGDAAPTATVTNEAFIIPAEHFEFMMHQKVAEAEAEENFDPAYDQESYDEDGADEAGFVEMAEEGEHHFDEAAAAEIVTPAWAQMSDIEDFAPTATSEPAPEPDPDWAAAAEASVIASLEAEAQDAVSEQLHARFDDAQENYLDQDMKIDEDLLRELVRDVLREELAGRIGERITRNIRKLVRAEIAMALAAQDLS